MPTPRVISALRFVGAAVGCCLLTGCAVTGTAVVGSDDIVTLDVTLWQREDIGMTVSDSGEEIPDSQEDVCAQARNRLGEVPDTLSLERVTASGGGVRYFGCHAMGTVPVSQMTRWGSMGRIGDRYVFDSGYSPISMEALSLGTGDPPRFSITFPSPITDHDPDAIVSGNTVTWARDEAEDTGSSYAAAEASSPRAEIPLALLGGLVVGAALGVAGVARLGMRRQPAADENVAPEAEGAPE